MSNWMFYYLDVNAFQMVLY